MTRSLFGLVPEALVELLEQDGVEVSLAEARRILAHVIAEGGEGVQPRKRPVARRVAEAVSARCSLARPTIVERAEDPGDGFVKLLLRHHDGALTEAVRIPLEKRGRFTVCLSSQVGCAMGCAFCATGKLGLTRNLEAGEIVAAFCAVRDDVRAAGLGDVSGAVFMGQGEPLHNYDEVLRAARVLAHPCGGRIRQEAISISTVGLTDRIRRYTREGHPYRLVVSLTSAVKARREKLLPVAGQLDLDDLCAAIREHAEVRGQRITVAWVMLGGVNMGDDEVEALTARLGGVPLRLSLIDVNTAPGDESGFRRASDAERAAFFDGLSALEVPLVRRYSGGRDRHAACGMLAAVRQGGHSDGGVTSTSSASGVTG